MFSAFLTFGRMGALLRRASTPVAPQELHEDDGTTVLYEDDGTTPLTED